LSDHLSQNQIEGYGRRALTPAELLAVSDHLSLCDLCRRQTERALHGDAAIFSLKSALWSDAAEQPAHLREEQIVDFVDGRLAKEDARIVTDHIHSCEPCQGMVEDLQQFREAVTPGLDRNFQPAAARIVEQPTRSGFREWLGGLWPQSIPLTFASGLALLLLALAGWMIVQRIRSGEKPSDITQTSPTPTVVPSPQSPVAPEEFLARLKDGDIEYRLDRAGRLSGAESLPPKAQQWIQSALSGHRLEKSPLLAGIAGAPDSALRAGPGETDALAGFALLRPIGKVLLSDRPIFQWSRLAGASNYIVEIYDEQFNLVRASPAIAATSWTVSEPLKRGMNFSWQVKLQKEGQEYVFPRPPAPQAKFRVLDRAKADEILQAQRSYPSSHLPLGLLYADAGLLDDAEREFRALQKANPGSPIARRLLSQAQAMRR
jgi:hypothetical protein